MAKHLESLYVKNFRCLDELTIDTLGDVNLLVGGNNSGKTTVLEALKVYASKGMGVILADIASSHDEYKGNAKDENDYVEVIESLFNCRKLPDNDEDFIAIGESTKSENLLRITDTYYYTTQSTKSGDDGEVVTIKKNIIKKNELESYKEKDLKKAIRISYKQHAAFLPKSPIGFLNFNFIPSNTVFGIGLAESLGKIAKDGKLFNIIDGLKIIHEDIEDIRLRPIIIENKKNNSNQMDFPFNFSDKPKTETIIDIEVKDDPRSFPIKSMGEGMLRMLQLILAGYDATNGILLIDEIENGLHYSIQEKVWEWLFKLAKQYNMQIFATTHSWDIIKNFNTVAQRREEEGVLVALGREPAMEGNGKLLANPMKEEVLDIYVKNGKEMR